MEISRQTSKNIIFYLALGIGFQNMPQSNVHIDNCASFLSVEKIVLTRTISNGARAEIDPLVWNPFQVFRTFRSKWEIQRRQFPADPYGFTVGEIFEPTVRRLVSQVENKFINQSTKVSKATLTEIQLFQRQFVERGNFLLDNNVPYEAFVLWTRAYSQLMTLFISATSTGQLHNLDFKTREVMGFRRQMIKDKMADIFDQTGLPSDFAFFYYPTDLKLSEMDLLRARGVPVYFLGLVERMVRGDDGLFFNPFEYWIHDLKAHAEVFIATDAAMFSKPGFTYAGPFGLRTANAKWTKFLNGVDSIPSDDIRSPIVEFLFGRFHTQGWSIDQVTRVLLEAKKLGFFPNELKDFNGYNLYSPR